MDNEKIRQWENAVDLADQGNAALTSLPSGSKLGDLYVEASEAGERRVWRRVKLIGGAVGGRWAYWKPWEQLDERSGRKHGGVGPNPEHLAIADRVFNGDAATFIGLLALPYQGLAAGKEQEVWVLVEPKQVGPVVVHVREEGRKGGEERYERSKEVFDVESGESKMLP